MLSAQAGSDCVGLTMGQSSSRSPSPTIHCRSQVSSIQKQRGTGVALGGAFTGGGSCRKVRILMPRPACPPSNMQNFPDRPMACSMGSCMRAMAALSAS